MLPATRTSAIAVAAGVTDLRREFIAQVADAADRCGHGHELEQLLDDLADHPHLAESIMAWVRAWALVAGIELPKPRKRASA
jgi:hypothetical protein